MNASAGVQNPPKPGTTVVYFAPWIDVPHPIATAYGQDVSVVAFGVKIDQIPGNDNMFTNGPWRLEWVGPLWRFGTVSKRIPVATLQPASAAR